METLIQDLGKIPVSNLFLSKILKQTEYKEKIIKDFPRDFVSESWIPFFETARSNGVLIYCKDIDWHTDSDLKNREDYPYTILWVLKTKNSILKVKNDDSIIKSINLKKGMLVAFPNYKEHTLITKENNISCFLTFDFKNLALEYNSKSTKLRIKNFVDYIQSGNSIR